MGVNEPIPTMGLRFIWSYNIDIGKVEPEKILQQAFILPTGKTIWRDIQIEQDPYLRGSEGS